MVAPVAAVVAAATPAGAGYSGCSDSLAVSTAVPGQSDSVAADGDCFDPDTSVTVTLASPPAVVGSGTSVSDGSFSDSFVIPATDPLGHHTVTMTGLSLTGTQQVLTLDLTLVATQSAAASSGGLAFTGADAGILLGIAAALMALGAGLTTASVADARRAPTL